MKAVFRRHRQLPYCRDDIGRRRPKTAPEPDIAADRQVAADLVLAKEIESQARRSCSLFSIVRSCSDLLACPRPEVGDALQARVRYREKAAPQAALRRLEHALEKFSMVSNRFAVAGTGRGWWKTLLRCL